MRSNQHREHRPKQEADNEPVNHQLPRFFLFAGLLSYTGKHQVGRLSLIITEQPLTVGRGSTAVSPVSTAMNYLETHKL